MGEYGTPDVDIPEGFFEVEFRGRKDLCRSRGRRRAGITGRRCTDRTTSCSRAKIWGIRATDVMQGVVFGTRIEGMGGDPRLRTRLDFDQAFGTVINRFSCQAVIEHPADPLRSGRPGTRLSAVARLDAVPDALPGEPAESGGIPGIQPVRGDL